MSNVIYICPQDGTKHDDTTSRYCEVCGGGLRFYCVVHGDWLFGEVCPKCGGIAATAPAAAVTPAPASIPARVSAPVPPAVVTPPRSAPPVVVTAPRPTFRPAPPVAARYKSPAPQRMLGKSIAFAFLLFMGVAMMMLLVGVKSLHRTSYPAPPRTVVTAPAPQPAPERKRESVLHAPLKDEAIVFPNYPPIETRILEIELDPAKFEGKLVTFSGRISITEADKKSFDLEQDSRSIQIVYKRLPLAEMSQIFNAPEASTVKATGVVRHDSSTNSYYLLAREIEVR